MGCPVVYQKRYLPFVLKDTFSKFLGHAVHVGILLSWCSDACKEGLNWQVSKFIVKCVLLNILLTLVY